MRTVGESDNSGVPADAASNAPSTYGALRKGPPFRGSRNQGEIKFQNGSRQMGGHEAAGR